MILSHRMATDCVLDVDHKVRLDIFYSQLLAYSGSKHGGRLAECCLTMLKLSQLLTSDISDFEHTQKWSSRQTINLGSNVLPHVRYFSVITSDYCCDVASFIDVVWRLGVRVCVCVQVGSAEGVVG